MDNPADGPSRRELLGATAIGVIGGLAGCLEETPNDEEPPEAIELSVRAPPSDEAPAAAEIGRRLTENLDDAGIDASFVTRVGERFHADIHLERDFDIFVTQTKRIDDPDDLWPMFHSSYADGIGDWLNPFGLERPGVDALLEAQRVQTATDRLDALHELQLDLAAESVPLAVVAAPDELTAIRGDLPTDARPPGFDTPEDIISLGAGASSLPAELQVGIFDPAVTQRLNPFTGDSVGQPIAIGLIYDPLIRQSGQASYDWAAEEVVWEIGDEQSAAQVTLREGMHWHDGELVTPTDVTFTYELLQDLADGADDRVRPAGRYATQTSLIESIEQDSETELTFTFKPASRPLAERALTLPLLPEHIWADLTGLTEEGIPQPLVEDNAEPVGSGPFSVEDIDPGEELVLEAVEDHFAIDTESNPSMPSLRSLTMTVPSHPPTVGLGVSLVEDGELDMLAKVPPGESNPVIESPVTDLVIRPSSRRYVIGFNTKETVCADPAFRRVVATAIDRTFIVGWVFGGFAQPADSLLARTIYESPELEWTGESILGSFPGTSDIIDEEAIRDRFAEAGYPFDEQAGVIYHDE